MTFLRITFFVLFLISLANAADIPPYDRNKCDNTIEVNNFIKAGSMDDPSPGGRIYRFDRIVGSIKNELLGGSEPRPKNFDCMLSFLNKARNDQIEFWGNRLATSACADANNKVPKVQPANCDDKTWNEYHSSMKHIDWAKSEVQKLQEECVVKDGKKSCEAMASMDAIRNLAAPIAATGSDKCCDKNEGSAYKVLRGFYTIELGHLSEANLQKECYKRTRPTNSYSVVGTVGGCMYNILKGFAESVVKTLKTIVKLADLGMWWEVIKAFSSDPAAAVGRLVKLFGSMVEQAFNQGSSIGCFTGEYKTDHICKLAASIATDFLTPGFLLKGAKYLVKAIKGPASGIASIAKELVGSSPKAKALSENLSKMTASVKSGTSRAVSTARSLPSSVAAAMANRGAAMARGMKNGGNAVAEITGRARQKFGEKLAGNNPDGSRRLIANNPQGKIEVPTTTAPATQALTASENAVVTSAANTSGSAMTSSTRIAASSKSGKGVLDTTQAKEIRSGLDRNGLNSKVDSPMVGPETRLFTTDAKLRQSSDLRKRRILETGAERRRREVAQLRASEAISAEQAGVYLQGIENALKQAKAKYKIVDAPKPAAIANSATTESKAARPSEDYSIPPVGAAPEVGAQAGANVARVGEGAAATGDNIAGAAGTSAISQADNFIATSTKASDFTPFYQSVKAGPIPAPAATASKSIQDSYRSLQTYIDASKNTYAASGTNAAAMKSSVYGNSGYWSMSRKTDLQHRNVEALRNAGIISDEIAEAHHHIIRSTERIATDMGRTTSYSVNGSRVTTPNTGPNMFTRIGNTVTSKPVARTVGVVSGSAATVKEFQKYSESNGSGFNEDTIAQAETVVDKLANSPATIVKEFDDLKTEDAIHDRADELRAKIKTVQATASKRTLEENGESLNKLLESVNRERNKALARIGKPVPEGEPIEVAAPAAGSGKPQADAATAADAASKAAPAGPAPTTRPVLPGKEVPPAKPALPTRVPARNGAPSDTEPDVNERPAEGGVDTEVDPNAALGKGY